MSESFDEAIKALRHIARGNGNVMRIADRIVDAHNLELSEMITERNREWVKLPLCADGLPVRPGDILCNESQRFEVAVLRKWASSTFYIDNIGFKGGWSVLDKDGNAYAMCDFVHWEEPDSFREVIVDAMALQLMWDTGKSDMSNEDFNKALDDFVERCKKIAKADE